MTAAVQPRSESLTINGLALRYLDWGNDGALPLILLHGLGGAAAEWRRVAEHFRERYRVLALDQRGHGDSEHAPAHSYATADYVADLEAFADALGLERFVLTGHSMGGHTTIAFTARHPERVACALANDIPPALQRGAGDRAAQFPDGRQPVFPTIEAWIESRAAGNPFTPPEMHRLAAEARLAKVEGGYQPKADPDASVHWAPEDLWEEARGIVRPILFVRGGQSGVLDAETLQRMDMQIEPARSVTLEQAGHNTFMDMEPEFLSAASQFFAAHSR